MLEPGCWNLCSRRIRGHSPILLSTMITLHTATPSAALRGFVRVYAQREVTSFLPGAVWVTEPVPARLEQTLEFQLGAPFTVHLPQGDLTTPEQVIVGAHVYGAAQID